MPVSIAFLGEGKIAEMAGVGTRVEVRFHVIFDIWELVKALGTLGALEVLVKTIGLGVQEQEGSIHFIFFDFDGISVFHRSFSHNCDKTTIVRIKHGCLGKRKVTFKCSVCSRGIRCGNLSFTGVSLGGHHEVVCLRAVLVAKWKLSLLLVESWRRLLFHHRGILAVTQVG